MTVEEFERLLEGKKPIKKKIEKAKPTPRDFSNVLPEQQIFCFTGTLSDPRAVLEDIAYSSGAEVRNAVSRNVTYLVAQNINGRSSKLQEARRLGIPIITEEEFIQITEN